MKEYSSHISERLTSFKGMAFCAVEMHRSCLGMEVALCDWNTFRNSAATCKRDTFFSSLQHIVCSNLADCLWQNILYYCKPEEHLDSLLLSKLAFFQLKGRKRSSYMLNYLFSPSSFSEQRNGFNWKLPYAIPRHTVQEVSVQTPRAQAAYLQWKQDLWLKVLRQVLLEAPISAILRWEHSNVSVWCLLRCSVSFELWIWWEYSK